MILLLSMMLSLSAQAEGTVVTGKNAAELYQSINNTGFGQCGSGCVDVSELSCNWSNSPDSKRITCSFKDANGKNQTVNGAKARRISNAVMAVQKIEPSCGAGTCGFDSPRNIKCAEKKTVARNFRSECSVSTYEESCLSAENKKDLENLKMKFSVTQEANPGCETMRGAGGCLHPHDMLKMQRLENMEKNGCRAEPSHGRDEKPTMEAK